MLGWSFNHRLHWYVRIYPLICISIYLTFFIFSFNFHFIFAAQFLGLPLVPPFLQRLNSTQTVQNFEAGVNFAVIGATGLDASFLATMEIHSPSTNNSLRIQLEWFKQMLPSLCNTSLGNYITREKSSHLRQIFSKGPQIHSEKKPFPRAKHPPSSIMQQYAYYFQHPKCPWIRVLSPLEIANF